MILFLYGTDNFRTRQRQRFLEQAFKDKYDPQGINVLRIDGGEFTTEKFHTYTKSAGLFSQKQFISLHSVWQLNKDDQDTLRAALETIDPNTILCITAGEPPRKDNPLFKQLLKSDKVEEYTVLTPVQLRQYIRKNVEDTGATIETQAVEFLAASVGTDLWRMSQEIKKLTYFTRHISLQDVEQFVTAALDENIFHLTDALGNRNAKEASRLLDAQVELGANVQYLLTMLGRHIMTLYKVKKTDGDGLAMHPYVLKKSIAQARRFSLEQLAALSLRVLEIDQETKSGSRDPRVLLDLLIVEACRS